RTLMQGAAGYARALDAAGIPPGEVVVLILQHGEALVYAFFGAILHGAIPSIMPFLTEKLTPDKYRQDLAALIEVTRPAAIVTYPDFVPEVRAAVRPGGPVRAVLVSADIPPAAGPDLGAMPGLRRFPDDVVLLQHSSGTTGLQKGVALSHRAVLNQLDCYARALRLTLDDVIVSWLPLYHDMGLIAGFVMPIMNRAPLVLMSPFDWVRAPGRLMQAVSRYRGTLSWLPNFAYNFCAQKTRDRDLEGVDLSSWRAVVNCSEPMHWKSHQMFLERFEKYGLRPSALATCYAMAENVFAVTQGGIDAPVVVDEVDQRALLIERRAVPTLTPSPSPLQGDMSPGAKRSGEGSRDEGNIKLLSAGRPLPNVRVRVLDDQRRELPERHLGEIALHSDCMLTGYYNRDDATAKAFHEGWYLTGDLGYVADGEVYVTGRKKDLIIVGGKNVYPQDLERLAGDVTGVHAGRVVAFGVFDEEAGTEEVVVVAEAEADDSAERQRLADEIRQRVTRGSDVALRHVHVVGPRWLLKTSSGKIARAANREKYLEERER
ncbi:MAG: fatty-acyl-CoA synthase, partial [Anaerolineales bacterium]|nr:fatty-acyl-CoA synthase [Anaerolineales bacterium]